AYNPDIVVGVWVGNTAPNGGGGLITAFGESVGPTIMARVVNTLPRSMEDWYKPPPGIVHGCGAQAQEIFLSGTQGCTPGSSSPTATPGSSPTASPSPAASPSPSAIPPPSPSPEPTPSAAPSPPPPSPPAPAPTPSP